jgi:hypothetical protein
VLNVAAVVDFVHAVSPRVFLSYLLVHPIGQPSPGRLKTSCHINSGDVKHFQTGGSPCEPVISAINFPDTSTRATLYTADIFYYAECVFWTTGPLCGPLFLSPGKEKRQ